MQRMLGVGMKVICNTAKVLTAVKENRDKHTTIFAEAKDGFLKEAAARTKALLAELEAGKIVPLQINLFPPRNHTSEYDTVIQMLEMHTGDEIELGSDEIRMFVQDKWDWTETFLASSAGYSKMAQDRYQGMGG
jgi:hypothetical protein